MSLAGHSYYAVCRTRVGHCVAALAARALRAVGVGRAFRLPIDCLALPHRQVRALMRLWRRIHLSSADGMMPGDQLLAIYDLVSRWPGRGDTVELGSWVGLTTCYLATATQVHGTGRVYAVDTFEGTKEGGDRYAAVEKYGGSTLRAFREQIDQAGVADVVEPLVGMTQDVARRYPGEPIRVLLIDADHSFDGVKRDFRRWSPLVEPGGLIIFHDYQMPDVARFVDEEVGCLAGFRVAPGPVVPNVISVTKAAFVASEIRTVSRQAVDPRCALEPTEVSV